MFGMPPVAFSLEMVLCEPERIKVQSVHQLGDGPRFVDDGVEMSVRLHPVVDAETLKAEVLHLHMASVKIVEFCYHSFLQEN